MSAAYVWRNLCLQHMSEGTVEIAESMATAGPKNVGKYNGENNIGWVGIMGFGWVKCHVCLYSSSNSHKNRNKCNLCICY